MQFAINTSRASRPRRTPGTALPVRRAARVQAVTHHSQLAQPRKARENPGRDSDHHSPAVTQATPTPTPKLIILRIILENIYVFNHIFRLFIGNKKAIALQYSTS